MKYLLLYYFFSAVFALPGYLISLRTPGGNPPNRDFTLGQAQGQNLYSRSPVMEFLPLNSQQLRDRKQALLQNRISPQGSPAQSSEINEPKDVAPKHEELFGVKIDRDSPRSPRNTPKPIELLGVKIEKGSSGSLPATPKGSPIRTRPQGTLSLSSPIRPSKAPLQPQKQFTATSQRKSSGESQKKSITSSKDRGSEGTLYKSISTSSRHQPSDGSLFRTSTSSHRSHGSKGKISIPLEKGSTPQHKNTEDLPPCPPISQPRTLAQWTRDRAKHYLNVIQRKPTMVTTIGAGAGATVQTIGTLVNDKPAQIAGGAVVSGSLWCLGAIQAHEQDVKQSYAERHPDEVDPNPNAEKYREKYRHKGKEPSSGGGPFSGAEFWS